MEGLCERGGGAEALWAELEGRTGASRREDRQKDEAAGGSQQQERGGSPGLGGGHCADQPKPRINWTCHRACQATESLEATHGGIGQQQH